MMSGDLQDIHILIVDDEESIRVTFEMFLKRAGYGRISTAATMEEALLAINEERFDLIISDIVLEGAKGTDLLRHIQQTGLRCPVVMITGFPNLETAADAVRYGAFDYISKPVNKETLLRFVRQALSHWQLQKEKKLLQQENEKYRRYLEVIFSSVSDAIITVDEHTNIIQLNNTAREWLGSMEPEGVINLAGLSDEIGKACLHDATRVINHGETVKEHLVECEMKDGTVRMISLNAAPLKDSVDEFNGAVIVMRDITMAPPTTVGPKRTSFRKFIGSSQVMQDVYQLIENVGRVDTAVLITGESGTGKELAAEALHAESLRKSKPLIKVDCAAIPEDLLESELFGHKKGAFTGADRDRKGRLFHADGGTLFLDEIGDISPRMQLRLLRFLQEQTFTPVGQDISIQVNVRIIAATNVNLKEKVRDGGFREDLYYRLKVVEILLPPLRARKGCVPLLVHHFLSVYRDKLNKNIFSISDQAMELLCNYRWPGNVRELRHVIERACVLCNGTSILVENFPKEIKNDVGRLENRVDSEIPERRQRATDMINTDMFISEEEQILSALKSTGGNKTKAAQLLKIDRSTLYRKMKRYDL